MLQQLILLLGHVQGTIKAHCASEEPWGELGCGGSCPCFAVCSSFPSNSVAERGKYVLLIAELKFKIQGLNSMWHF